MDAGGGPCYRFADIGRQAEALGWDGITTVDSQNLSTDPYVCLAFAGHATSRLGVMTSVTNTATRVPAVTASSAMTVQHLTKGRMVIGIGRGDSALAHLGRAPSRLAWFERYLVTLQAYLRGEDVSFADTCIPDDAAPLVDTLGLAEAPSASRIAWAQRVSKVPVEVAATGERVIAIAARHAERIMFALGAQPERLQWGIDVARKAAAAAGRDPASLAFGAYVNLACHDDATIGRELARAGTSLFARFSVMHGKVSGPADDTAREVFKNIHDRYDMNKHAQAGGNQTTALTDAFMDAYAVIGDARHCVERLRAIEALGIDKIAVTGPNFHRAQGEAKVAAERFVAEVMPAFR
ncbi:MAG: LLM class flavin-dependent oxidoreductase [Pseudomonadales bacterium]